MAKDISTLTFDDFGIGIDRRLGLVSRVANKFYDLHNYIITAGRKVQRRSPLRRVPGLLSDKTQGSFYVNGKVVTVAPAGTTVVHTIGMPSSTVFFDLPPGASDGWELIDLQAFNEKLVAVIAHTYDSATAPRRVRLHVWDDKRPTFVTDPACPTTWGPSFPLHPYGDGTLGAYVDYSPIMAISADRVYLIRPDGNVGFSASGDPRVWNTRSVNEILADGIWRYFVSTNKPGDLVIDLDLPYQDLVQDQRFAAYVCETCQSNGQWMQLREQTILSAYGDYKLEPIPNMYKPTDPPQIRLTIRFPGDGRVFRFRAIAKPPAVAETGLYVVLPRRVVGGVLTHEDNGGAVIGSYDVPALPTPDDYYIAVGVPNAPIPTPSFSQGSLGSMPLNGQERYWTRIIANVKGDGSGNFLYALTGNATITVDGTRVTGAGTLFTSELEVGRQITINGERRVVKFIGSDTDLEVDLPFSTAYTGVALKDPRYRYAYEIGDTGNEWYADLSATITFNLAGKDDAGYLGTSTYDSSGELPVSLSVAQNRLLVQFKANLQLWSVGAVATADMRLLSKDGQSSGIHTRPRGVLVDGYTAIPTANGVRLFAPDGNNKDYIDFIGVGDMLRGIILPDLTRAIWWPHIRAFITCGRSDNAGVEFYCLFKHNDTKVLGWSRWVFDAITVVDDLFIHEGDLVIRSGRELHRVTTADTDYMDDGDVLPYESFGRFIFCDCGSPRRNKKVLRVETVQEGSCAISLYVNPSQMSENVLGPSNISGTTFGLQRLSVGAMGPGIGLAFSSRDRTGHLLDSVAFDYTLLNR